MPNFLKSLFKPSPSRRSRRPGALPPDVHFTPPTGHAALSSDELSALTQMLQDRLTDGHGGERHSVLEAIRQHPQGGEDTMRQLTAVLKGTTLSRDTLIPSQSPRFSRPNADHRPLDVGSRTRRARRSRRLDPWAEAVEACSAALALAEKLCDSIMARQNEFRALLARICSLLEAQKDELLDIRPHAEGHGLPTLSTLRQIYLKMQNGLQEISGMSRTDAEATLSTLVQVLLEGPDYLIDVTIIEAIVWQAEVIEPSFGAEIRQILDKTVAGPPDEPSTFKRAAQRMIAIASALPQDQLDDVEAIEAYKAIGILIKQLQVRLGSSRPGSPSSSQLFRPSPQPRSSSSRSFAAAATPQTFSTTPSPVGSPLRSPVRSPTRSRDTSPSTTPDPDLYTIDNAADLQAMYGTGPIATPSKTVSLAPTPRTPAAAPEPSEPDTEEPEVWEYRGNLLTRSALSLVLRQEALAKADSSGQYAGEVSWDDLRNAWIPKWAEKLKPEDVADGEIPSTNPAMYKMKKKDAWGNRIGWRDGVMYYEDEPSFDLREDD